MALGPSDSVREQSADELLHGRGLCGKVKSVGAIVRGWIEQRADAGKIVSEVHLGSAFHGA